MAAGLVLGMVLVGCERRGGHDEGVHVGGGKQLEVRVLLEGNTGRCSVGADSPLVITNVQTGEVVGDLEVSQRVFSLAGGVISIADSNLGGTDLFAEPNEGVFEFEGRKFRGRLRLTVNEDLNSFDAVNYVALESYLAGVIGAEMPDYWEPEALKAQAIAARTYCVAIKKQFGAGRGWDVKRTQAHQRYEGLEAESNNILEAVLHTKGIVCTSRDKDSEKVIFPTYYSAVCGGHTEDSANVFGDSYGPLEGVVCPWCKLTAKPKYYYWPTATYSKQEVYERLVGRYPQLEALGRIEKIEVVRKSDYREFSRLTYLRLVGADGAKDSLRAEDFRLAIDPTGTVIRSAAFEIKDLEDKWAFTGGRGFGHGVGLCQCGAEGMARDGKTALEIIGYYFPGCEAVRIY